MQVVVFELGQERYAIETHKIQGIDKITNITNVPCAPNYIKGLINLRGSIISLYDPYIMLGIANDVRNYENILIVESDDEQIGIIVDRVIEVIEIDSSDIKNVSVSREDESEYITGTVNMDGYLVTLIDVDALLNAA